MNINETNRELRGHIFFPSVETLESIPRLYATEATKTKDKIVHLHYFVGGCDWWIAELDPDEMLAFGYACLGSPQDAEWGYVSLTELEQIVAGAAFGPVAVVERDLYWTPKSVAECDLPGFR